ncbi:MAG: prepilin-type N-terminal cleavage/methylation domain-containing protein [Caldimicrobium sp.]|nr:prepilin-type N-terminal cleavage/methylation domain-containing protein [Caldimicrobium sp.]
MKGKVRGFTLVELAIVLVIIGIILGAVLKGQELIFNAKVKRLQSQAKELMAAVYTYYDKYGYFPGDDPSAPTRWTGAPNGGGDGFITAGYCDAPAEESCYVFRHLRYANIITGDPTVADPTMITPKHAWGGPINVFHGNYTIGGTPRQGLWMTFHNLPGEAAEAFDRLMDDGKCNSGSMGAYAGACDSNGNYQRDVLYHIWFNW